MAKALFGHTGPAVDLRLLGEVRSLRSRVTQLESEIERLRTINETLMSSVLVDDDLLRLSEDHQHALA